ncbi:MAG TPA: sulfate adenylyltransferase subunit CysN [Acetobacteraceae bacterium]|jgi:bifunctional enzyme CysN/CysC|nr:sulfate adenylyltransferase subunit CysN [Acetobacteraceae bacterium]
MSAALQLAYPDEADQQALAPGQASLLHFLTCGSVDDGKSTLLGRLLFDSNAVLDDQLSALDRDSRRFGTQGEARDFALLVDGLSAEREQGITIDVAYRYFSTARRSFIVADTPGHEQYTRNMATGASTAELAIILIDARKGVLPQTRRHSYIVSMLGVRNVVLAVNKMDLVGFSADVYQRIIEDYRRAVASLGFTSIVSIPICARDGDNVASVSGQTPWYSGPVLLDYLETVSVDAQPDADHGFHFPVQLVNRPNLDFRGYAGTVASGVVRAHQPVRILPSGQLTRIESIVTADGALEAASAGQAVTLTLTSEVDVSRGDVIVAADDALAPATAVTARLLWMVADSLTVGQTLLARIGTASANARVARIHHAIDIHSFQAHTASSLGMNEIAVVELTLDKKLVSTDYASDRTLGALILVDRMTNQTVALGVVEPAPGQPAREVSQDPGGTVAPKRAPGWQAAIVRVLGAAVLGLLVIALSGGWLLATVVAVAEVGINLLIGWAVWGAWKPGVTAAADNDAVKV